MKNPKDKVKSFLTNDSQQAVNRYITVTQPLLDAALRHGKMEIVMYTLEEVRILAECTKLEKVQQLLTEVLERVKNYFNSLRDSNVNNFRTHFNPKNEFGDEACAQLSTVLAQLESADKLLETVNAEPMNLHQELFQALSAAAYEVIEAPNMELLNVMFQLRD